jgi:hypothetical protein
MSFYKKSIQKLVLAFLLFAFIDANAGKDPSKTTKHQLSICAIFKNESPYLKEWIEYHRLVGVDHFYLYNVNSSDLYDKVLHPYIEEGVVTLVHWFEGSKEQIEGSSFAWMLSTQASAYENAILLRKQETEWLCFLDVQEFLVPGYYSDLSDLLKRYKDYPGILLASDFFDGSRFDRVDLCKLLIETAQLTCAPCVHPHRQVAKMIFKPSLTDSTSWAPYRCHFKNGKEPIALCKNEIRINHYLNRNPFYLDISKAKKKSYVDHRLISEQEKIQLLENDYVLEDHEKVVDRFIPELLHKLAK